MSNGVCIGALDLEYRAVRVLPQFGHAHPHDAAYRLGDVWDLPLRSLPFVEPPHVEDAVLTGEGHLIDRVQDVGQWVLGGITPWRGPASEALEGQLQRSESGRVFVGKDQIPSSSVGFWIPDRPLVRVEQREREFYSYTDHGGARWRFSYAGTAPSLKILPAGVLVRLSLARWWAPDDSSLPEACYAQVSGWFPVGEGVQMKSWVKERELDRSPAALATQTVESDSPRHSRP